MEALQPPDSHLLSAAIGWWELGNREECRRELRALSRSAKRHPDTLELRWQLDAEARRWKSALKTARAIVEADPERVTGWLHQAYAARRADKENGLPDAWEILLLAYEQFPDEPTVTYNLGCYACQLDRVEEARGWLQLACEAASKKQIQRMALADDDLKPLWNEIRKWTRS